MLRRALLLSAVSVLILASPALAFNFAPLETRRPMPEITFLNGAGEEVSLADFAGEVVVLNLWATWCAPCRREMPALDRLQAEHGESGLEIIALSQDRGEALDKIRNFYDEVGVSSLAIYRDPSAQSARELKAPGLPTTIVIDRQGREVGRVLGDTEWDSPEALSLLQALMEEQDQS